MWLALRMTLLCVLSWDAGWGHFVGRCYPNDLTHDIPWLMTYHVGVYIYILYVWCIYIYTYIYIDTYDMYIYIYRFRRHLQPHTGVHEHIYFAVCIVIFLSFDSVVFFGPVIRPCLFFVIFRHFFFAFLFAIFHWFPSWFDDFTVSCDFSMVFNGLNERTNWKSRNIINK